MYFVQFYELNEMKNELIRNFNIKKKISSNIKYLSIFFKHMWVAKNK